MNKQFKDYSRPMKDIMIHAILIAFGTIGLLIAIYYLLLGEVLNIQGIVKDHFYIYLILGIIVHEVIHVISWKVAGNIPWSEFTFGFNWKTFTPYAHIKIAVQKTVYVFGALTPLVLLGLVPFAIGIWYNDPFIAKFGVVFSALACGDVLIILIIWKVDKNALVKDHPTNAGCLVAV